MLSEKTSYFSLVRVVLGHAVRSHVFYAIHMHNFHVIMLHTCAYLTQNWQNKIFANECDLKQMV